MSILWIHWLQVVIGMVWALLAIGIVLLCTDMSLLRWLLGTIFGVMAFLAGDLVVLFILAMSAMARLH